MATNPKSYAMLVESVKSLDALRTKLQGMMESAERLREDGFHQPHDFMTLNKIPETIDNLANAIKVMDSQDEYMIGIDLGRNGADHSPKQPQCGCQNYILCAEGKALATKMNAAYKSWRGTLSAEDSAAYDKWRNAYLDHCLRAGTK